MLVLGLFITKVLLVTYIRKFANICLYFCRKQKAHLEVADTLSGWYSREKWNFLGVVFSYTIIQYDINTIIAACSLTWRGRLFSPIGRLPVFVRLEKFHFSPRTTQALLATFLSGHPGKVPIFSRGCPCLFLKGLGSLPHRCRLMLSARKVELLCNFIRRGITLLSSPSGLRLSRPQPADNSNGHHAPQAQARGLLPLCEHLWLPFTELRPHYIYDSQDLI